MTLTRLVAAGWIALGIAACAAGSIDEDSDDPIDEAFAYTSDAVGIREGSPEALAVLRVASMLPRDELRHNGISSNACTAIVRARSATATTANGELDGFPTLAALDAVPYVGRRTFSLLLAYAREHAHVFEPSTASLRQPVADGLGEASARCYIERGRLLPELPAGTRCGGSGALEIRTTITLLKPDMREGDRTRDFLSARTAFKLPDGRSCYFDQGIQHYGCFNLSCAEIAHYSNPTCR